MAKGTQRSVGQRIPTASLGQMKACGLARALSRLGFCSRSEAWKMIQAGRVRVNGVTCRDPEGRTRPTQDRIEVDCQQVQAQEKIYLMLNKPSGLVTTLADEKGRKTVFDCFNGHDLPFISPVGRLDQASEGLLLFTNDSAWSAGITNPASHVPKTYHVQVNCVPDATLREQLRRGGASQGEKLSVHSVGLLRHGQKNSWLEIVLEEGRNRHIRRLLELFNIRVLRLVRVSIGPLQLGGLAKGKFRLLVSAEIHSLAPRTAPNDQSL